MAAYKARLSPPAPRKIAEPRDVGHIAPQPASEPAHTLLSISADAREAVLSQLNAADLCQCQLVCKALREEACSDSLWRRLCNCQWAGTHAGAWLSTSRSNPGPEDSRMSGPYTNYRQLYPALLRYDSVVGVWRAPAGNLTSLFRFRWARDCIEGSRLTYTVGPGGPKTSLSVDIGGSGSNAQIEDLTTDECTLAIPPPAPLHRSPSQGAQAAAAVAANRAADAAVFGTSPKGSFNHEIAHWMDNNIAKPRRRNSRGSLQRPPSPTMHHLLRVQRPMPSRRHPLAGLWRGNDPDQFPNVAVLFRVTYDFSGDAARIVATPLYVSRYFFPGELPIWSASAAAVPMPLEDEELHWLETRNTLAESDAEPRDRQVITICKGAAQRSDLFSTFGHGRLFVYADGDIGFLFIAGEQPALVDYTRIDADLA